MQRGTEGAQRGLQGAWRGTEEHRRGMEGHRGMESTGALRGIGNMEGHREHGGGHRGA